MADQFGPSQSHLSPLTVLQFQLCPSGGFRKNALSSGDVFPQFILASFLAPEHSVPTVLVSEKFN